MEGEFESDVTRKLQRAGIRYEVRRHSKQALTCELAAEERGVRVSQIVKCMVGQTSQEELVVMLLPGNRKLKISKVRKFLRQPTLNLTNPNDLARKLGLTVGAISPVQLMGRSTMLADPTVVDEGIVDISSGDPLAGVELRSRELIDFLGAEVVDIISARS